MRRESRPAGNRAADVLTGEDEPILSQAADTILQVRVRAELVESRTKARRFWWRLSFKCPRCGRTHHHAGGTGERPDAGLRVSHCRQLSGSYHLIVEDVT